MDSPHPRVCVLLAAFNGSDCIQNQLSSILSQHSVYVDIYVSIDKSSDNTFEILDEYSEQFSNIKIVSSELRFGSAAKNFYFLIENVDVSGYDYVSFADQDDIWFPDKLTHSIQSLSSGNVAGFSSDVYAFWPLRGAFSIVSKSKPQRPFDYFFESPGPGCSQVLTATSFAKFQSFFSANRDALYQFDYHDWLLYAYYRDSNFGWTISDSPRMLYIQHGANQIGANSGVSGIYKRLKMIRSNWYLSQIAILSSVFHRPELLSRKFYLRHALSLRRSKVFSLAVSFMFLFRIM